MPLERQLAQQSALLLSTGVQSDPGLGDDCHSRAERQHEVGQHADGEMRARAQGAVESMEQTTHGQDESEPEQRAQGRGVHVYLFWEGAGRVHGALSFIRSVARSDGSGASGSVTATAGRVVRLAGRSLRGWLRSRHV